MTDPCQEWDLLGVDTETTGVDFFHGSKPFMVTMFGVNGPDPDEGTTINWEWDVDPVSRWVIVPPDDADQIRSIISKARRIVTQNGKFDVHALMTVIPDLDWPWDRMEDTLIAGHLLASSRPHDLTRMVSYYLGEDIEPFEKALESVVQDARSWAKANRPQWSLAKVGRPDMPSATTGAWRSDYWLPRAAAMSDRATPSRGQRVPRKWLTALGDYASEDSEKTLRLWLVMEKMIKDRGLWKIYRERMKLLRVAQLMEWEGVSVNRKWAGSMEDQCTEKSLQLRTEMTRIASTFGYDLTIPKSGNNGSMTKFCYDVLKLPILSYTETGKPSLDSKVTVPGWIRVTEDDPDTRKNQFVRSLKTLRKYDTSINYLKGYDRFMIDNPLASGWCVLHPLLNPTGTGTLRWSSSNPNEQNISKWDEINVRSCFGPPPGCEWWSLDYQNLELRIPAFQAGETDVIYVFENPDDPPYYGSYHLLVADLLHPEKFKKHGKAFKDVFEQAEYKWVKNGNFAVIYGAQEKTADAAYRVRGAYKMIQARFPKIAALNMRMIAQANKVGIVETVPDRSVDPLRGYPIECSRNDWGKISPTVPLNYYVQSTAMWLTARAMVRCQEYFDQANRRDPGLRGRIVMQVHDELVVEVASRSRPDGSGPNMGVVAELVDLMEQCGRDVGVPTPTSATYHPRNWGKGIRVSLAGEKKRPAGWRVLEGSGQAV